jgi:cupin fold WbuC family metalloprotein
VIKIFSKKNNKKLLHLVYNAKDKLKKKRLDICNESQFIQAALIHLNKGETFRPHKHIWKKPKFKKTIAQESWVVLRGKVLFCAYDTNGKPLRKVILNSGSFSITFEGGHNYIGLAKNSKVIEYKTGPYEGVERDKVFI